MDVDAKLASAVNVITIDGRETEVSLFLRVKSPDHIAGKCDFDREEI